MKVLAYRGEHGDPSAGDLQTLVGSYTFVERQDVALTYATSPNDHRMSPVFPRVIQAEIEINNPVFDLRDDPFVDMSILIEKFGFDAAASIALRHVHSIEGTSIWEEECSCRYAGIGELIAKFPNDLGKMYMDAFRLLDDQAFLALAKSSGYDGAIHIGNGESACEIEYRVFSLEQIKILNIKPAAGVVRRYRHAFV